MSLPVLTSITKLKPNLIRILGQNPSKFTLQGTNCYLIGPAESLLLIDTAQGEESFDLLLKQVLKEISAHGGKAIIKNIILTHYHEDHINGLPQVLNLVKEFGFGGESGKPVVWKYPCEDLEKESVLNELIGVDGWQRLENGMKFEVGEGRLEVIHTPGHTQDSISLLLTGKDEIPSLFTADTVLGHGTAVFENLSAYIDSLELCIKKLESFLGEGNKFILYPGHGEIVEDGIEMMKGYIKHRLDREAQVLEALSTANAETSTAEELTNTIYAGTIPDSLIPAATRGVLLHLEKLITDRKVSRIPIESEVKEWLPGWNDRWKLVNEGESVANL